MAMTLTPEHDYEAPAPSRRRTTTKFALAGIAVLGVGAAFTSAAWTDDVFFGGTAEAGEVELQGSTDNVNFVDGDDANSIDLFIDDFVIGPNSSETHRVWVMNDGDLAIRLATVEANGTGALFSATGDTATVTAVSNDADGILQPGQRASIDVTVSGDADWSDNSLQGATSAIVVHVQGSTDLTPTP